MKNVVINKEQLIDYLFNQEKIGMGKFGLVIQYDNHTVAKIYYHDLIKTYLSMNPGYLDFEIKARKTSYSLAISSESIKNDNDKLEILFSKGLIKGVINYNDYKIGVLLDYYKNYVKLSEIYNDLNACQKQKVLRSAYKKYVSLKNDGIFPGDINENNIIVNKNNLDVKIIDLDDYCTKYNKNNKENFYMTETANKSFVKMVKRINEKD